MIFYGKETFLKGFFKYFSKNLKERDGAIHQKFRNPCWVYDNDNFGVLLPVREVNQGNVSIEDFGNLTWGGVFTGADDMYYSFLGDRHTF